MEVKDHNKRLQHSRSKTNHSEELMNILFPMENLESSYKEATKVEMKDLMKPLPSIPHTHRPPSNTISEVGGKSDPFFKFADWSRKEDNHSFSPALHRPTYESSHQFKEDEETTKAIEQNNTVNLIYMSSPVRKKSAFKPQINGFSMLHNKDESPVNPCKGKINGAFKVSLFSGPKTEAQHLHHLNKADDYYESSPDLELSAEKKKNFTSAYDNEQKTSISSKESLQDTSPIIQKPEIKLEAAKKSKDDLMNAMMMAFTMPKYNNIRSIGIKTEAGTLDGKKKKTNQDSLIFFPEFMGVKELHLFAILDGHGPKGHEVSQYVKNNFPKLLEKEIKKGKDVKKSLFDSIAIVSEDLNDSAIDTNFSGTTANIMVIQGKKVYSANLGDSRSILISENKSQLQSMDLTVDHKPDLKDEKERIEANGGRVEAILDHLGNPNGPARVWLKDQNYPGLAMSRSLGDECGHKAGVSSVPEISVVELKSSDKIIVLASDGVWEFLEGPDVLKIIQPYYNEKNVDKACSTLVQKSTENWNKEDVVVDDITVITIFLEIQ